MNVKYDKQSDDVVFKQQRACRIMAIIPDFQSEDASSILATRSMSVSSNGKKRVSYALNRGSIPRTDTIKICRL